MVQTNYHSQIKFIGGPKDGQILDIPHQPYEMIFVDPCSGIKHIYQLTKIDNYGHYYYRYTNDDGTFL